MKILTEFRNREVVHQELYEDRIIIVTSAKANGISPATFSTFICNKGFDILSNDIRSSQAESIESLIDLAKTTINQFL